MLLLATLAGAALASSPTPDASPAPRPDIAMHAWVRGGYSLRTDGASADHGPVLTLARLQARSTYQHRYRLFLQIGADRGKVALLDARATVDLGRHVELTAGRFKVPVSHEVLVPATEMLLPNRAQLVRMAPGRGIGMEAAWSRHGERVTPTVRAGVFDPLALGHDGFGGAQLVVQGDLHGSPGWFAHGATAVWAHAGDAIDKAGEYAPSHDVHGDLAAGWVTHDWTVDAELLVAHPTGAAGWDVGAGAVVARRIEAHHGDVVVEPVIGWDGTTTGEGLAHRATVGVNVHEDGWRLVQSAAWEVEVGAEGPIHLLIAQIQAGI